MKRCNAKLILQGVTFRCQREKGHKVGPYDRHKYVGKEPVHHAVYEGDKKIELVWNEPE